MATAVGKEEKEKMESLPQAEEEMEMEIRDSQFPGYTEMDLLRQVTRMHGVDKKDETHLKTGPSKKLIEIPTILNKLNRILQSAPDELRKNPDNLFLHKSKRTTRGYIGKVVKWFFRFPIWIYWFFGLLGVLSLICGTVVLTATDIEISQYQFIYLDNWLIWAGSLAVVALGLRLVFGFISFLMKKRLGFNSFFLYGLTDAFSMAVTVIVWVPLTATLLNGVEGKIWDPLQKVLTSLIVIFVLRLAKRFLDNYLSVKLQSENFFDRIGVINQKGKLLKTILRGYVKARSHKSTNHGAHAHIWEKIAKKPVIDAAESENAVVTDRRLLLEAVLTAERIYEKLKIPSKQNISQQQFKLIFTDELDYAFAIRFFDFVMPNDPLVIEYHELLTAILKFYKERQALSRDLHDRSQASQLLANVLGVLFWLVMVLIVLSIFGISFENYILPAVTSALGFVFIFGNSLQAIWQSSIFIFYVRPFDVGDYFRLSLDPPTYIVHRIRLLVTECFTNDGRLVVMPNSSLYTSIIYSYKRSKNASVSCTVQIAASTTRDQITNLTEYVMRWMRDTQQPFIWEELYVWIDSIKDSKRLSVGFWCELNGINWQSKWLRSQSDMLLAVQEGCTKLGLDYTQPAQPVLLSDAREVVEEKDEKEEEAEEIDEKSNVNNKKK